MLISNAAPSLLRRAANHSRAIRTGAGSRRDNSKALTTTLRATGNAETLCTLHAPLLNTRGLVADCDGCAIMCCVEEEGEGWVVKRYKTGAGFATMFKLGKDDEPTAFAADPEGTIAVAEDNLITTYDFEGNMRDHVAVEGTIACMSCLSDGRLIFTADDTMYMANLRVAVEDDFVMVFVAKQLVSHVKPSGGLALFHAAKKLLFINDHNSLCQLDIESKECRVITENMGAGRLCSGTDKSALFISPAWPAEDIYYYTPCSMEGVLDLDGQTMLPATTTDCCVNSQGGLLMLDQPGKGKLARLCLLRGLLPCSEAAA